jgi:hypothetical protein
LGAQPSSSLSPISTNARAEVPLTDVPMLDPQTRTAPALSAPSPPEMVEHRSGPPTRRDRLDLASASVLIRDSVWYAVVDDDWPRVKALLEKKIERHVVAARDT